MFYMISDNVILRCLEGICISDISYEAKMNSAELQRFFEEESDEGDDS